MKIHAPFSNDKTFLTRSEVSLHNYSMDLSENELERLRQTRPLEVIKEDKNLVHMKETKWSQTIDMITF